VIPTYIKKVLSLCKVKNEENRKKHMNWMDKFFDTANKGMLRAPPSAWWIVTRACNLACHYCFADARKRDPDELTTEEAKAVLDDFAENGVAFVTFLGGEPLTRPDIFDLIDYATDSGIYTAILTNGLLVRDGTIARLQDVGCEMLGVSIDNDDPAIHDMIRGRSGSLTGAQHAIRSAIRAGIRCSVRIVVTEESYPAIPRLFNWAIDEGVEELILLPVFMVGRAKGKNDRARDLTARALFLRTLDELREIAKKKLGIHVPENNIACPQIIELNTVDSENYHLAHTLGFEKSSGCKVGKYSVSVQPNGDIYPCPFVPVKIGNLREQSIRDIWQASLLRKARSKKLGCMARSLIHLGAADLPDPTWVRNDSSSNRKVIYRSDIKLITQTK
jgi:MoaA/NifB/PqqE/SkfB family radical SAM enzyme